MSCTFIIVFLALVELFIFGLVVRVHLARFWTAWFRRLSLLAALCSFALALPIGADAQQSRDLKPEDISNLANRTNMELLIPVQKSLKQQLRGDPRLSALVSSVKIRTLGVPDPYLGQNAAAISPNRGSKPEVLVDLRYLAEIMQISTLAGVALTEPNEAGKLMRSTFAEYERQLAVVALKGSALPSLEVNLSNLGGDPLSRDVAVRLGQEVSLTTTAFLVLHEIGHHVLHHTEANPSSHAVARKWELRADEWAFRELHELGYHLFYIDYFFQLQEILQELGLKYGLETSEAESDHPLYASRRLNLNSLYDIDKASPVRMLSYLGVGWDSRGKPQLIETFLPRYPDDDIQPIATIWNGYESSKGVCDWINGEGHIYGASAGMLTEVIVHNPDSMRTKVTIVIRMLETGEQQKVESVWIQTTLAWARPRSLGNLPISVVLDGPIITMMRDALRDAGVDAKTSSAVIREHSAFFAALRKGLVRYIRREISLADLATIMEARSAEFRETLRRTVGPTWTEAREQQLWNKLMATLEAGMVSGWQDHK